MTVVGTGNREHRKVCLHRPEGLAKMFKDFSPGSKRG